MTEETKTTEPKDVSRRAAIAAAGAALGSLMVPSVAQADDARASRKDVGKVSFEIANYKKSADNFERTENKSNTITKDSVDSTYPTGKAVYDFVKSYVDYRQGTEDAGKALFVGSDGNVDVEDYTVDSALSENSANPVQGDVIYKEIEAIKALVNLEEKPAKCTTDGCTKTHICKSGGMYHVYQEANACPSNFNDCELGVNYNYKGTSITANEQTWAINRVDDEFMALCEDEGGGVYCKAKTDTKWQCPVTFWHS